MKNRQNVSIVGLGHIGLPMMTILANLKKNGKYLYNVNAIEKNNKLGKDKQRYIKEKKFIFNTNDEKFNQLLKKTIKLSKVEIRIDFKNIDIADIIIISINFEIKKNKKDFNPLIELIRNIGKKIKKKSLILFETTLPPGTCEKILVPVLKKILFKRKISIEEIYFSYSFERVMPGKGYLNSITSNFRCYSGYNEKSKKKCKKFLSSFINIKKYPLFELKSLTECETAKILENSYRAINIAFIDEWTKFSNLMKIDLFNIIKSIKVRPTHSNMMNPGLGVGGYCLTKDPLFADVSSKLFFSKKISFPIIKKSISINKKMPIFALSFIKENFKLSNKSKILMLGLSYKEDTGDLRYSPSVKLLKSLLELNKNIKISDPFCKFNILKCNNFEIKNNLKKFDLILLCLKHKQYKFLNVNLFSKKTVIMDLNNVLDKKQISIFKKNKFKLFTLGNNAT